MAETTLLAHAVAVQDAQARLIPAADELPEPGRFLILEGQRRLATLVAEIRERESELDHLREALADRMNNLLMAIQTASDLLRTSAENGNTTTRVRDQLDAAVHSGRESLKQLRETLTNLR